MLMAAPPYGPVRKMSKSACRLRARLTRKQEGPAPPRRSSPKPVPPIAGPLLEVRHGHDPDLLRSVEVDDRIGEPVSKVPTRRWIKLPKD